MAQFSQCYFCVQLQETEEQRSEDCEEDYNKKKQKGKEPQKKQETCERDYDSEDKAKINGPKTCKDGLSKGSCDMPRQNSPHSHSKPA